MEAGRMDVEHSLSFVHYVKNILTGEKYTVYFVQQGGNQIIQGTWHQAKGLGEAVCL
jgi:hypothetical protein